MAALLAISFSFLLMGTYLWGFNLYIWDGGLLIVLGLSGIAFSLSRLWLSFTGVSLFPLREFLSVHWVLRLGALLLSFAVGLMARGRATEKDFTALLFLWGLAIALFVLSLLLSRTGRSLSAFTSSLPRTELGLLAFLLIVALFVRGIALDKIPANFGGDEGTQAIDAWRLVTRPLGNPFATGWYSVPTMSLLFYGAAMRLFGATMGGVRVLSALTGTLTVLGTFLLGQSLGGRKVAWIAALLVAFSAYHIHFSRLASNQIFDPFVGTFALWFLWRALYDSTTGYSWPAAEWGWAGIVMGLGWYTYFGARWVTFLVALFLLWRAFAEPRFIVRYWRGLLLLLAGCLVVAMPLLLWYLAHPSDLVARYNAVSIFASGWLSREVVVTGKPVFLLLFQQLWKAFTAFHLTPDPTFWYRPGAPLLDFVSGALLLVGLIATLLHWRWPSRGMSLLWFFSTVVMAWGVTENPPSSQRGTLLVPVVMLLSAWGVEALQDALVRYRKQMFQLTVLFVALACTLNLVFYFGIYTPRRVYGNPTAETTTEFARFVSADPLPGGTIYFFGAPYLYWDFGTLAFLLRDQPGVNIEADAQVPEIYGPARFVFVPERLSEFDAVARTYEEGKVKELYAPDDRLLLLIYDVPFVALH